MANRKLFTDQLFHLLSDFKYLLFNYDFPLAHKEKDELTLEFLLDKKEMTTLLNKLKNFDQIQHIKLSSNFRFSKVTIQFTDQQSTRILFIHKLMHKTLMYMDEAEVLDKRVLTSEGYFVPSIEHQFEEAVLHAFLNHNGLKEKHYRYFNDFHVLVQEDLIEFFNKKYGTHFSSLFSLTDYRPAEREKMIDRLKAFPLNRFVKKINVRWHNFMGVMRQARMI